MSQDLSPDVQKRLKLMQYWLFGIFVILSATGVAFSSVIMGSISGTMRGALAGWPIVLVAGVLCAGAWFGYRYWLTRKK